MSFCYQCEQTSKGTGCTTFSVCGKDEDTAVLQDLLLHAAKGVAQQANAARKLGASSTDIDRFILRALFLTVTNVNFDPQDIEQAIRDAAFHRNAARDLHEKTARLAGKNPVVINGPAQFNPIVFGTNGTFCRTISAFTMS